jgi:hypothetical protein
MFTESISKGMSVKHLIARVKRTALLALNMLASYIRQSLNASYESRKKVGYYFKIRRSLATLSMVIRLGTSSFR